MLTPEFSTHFQRDMKRLKKKHADMTPLMEVIDLVVQNDTTSLLELRTRHRMHDLKGKWAGKRECHVANLGDWLCVWQVKNGIAYFIRTGTHQEIFR
ncbi:MAG: type II toxin-antitoxin system YafQ family toxin [Microbacteriaceae bacterium]|nr:type II toxin-antitoxin system YafQ family toxin [Microbacteriaceae bacterium]